MIGSEFGARLRRLRGDRGLSLSELARRSGVDKGWLSHIEAGEGKNPSAALLVALAAALDVTVTALSGTARTTLPLPLLDPAEAAVLELFGALRMPDPLGFLMDVARLDLVGQGTLAALARSMAADQQVRGRPKRMPARILGDALRRGAAGADDATHLLPIVSRPVREEPDYGCPGWAWDNMRYPASG